MTEAGLAWVGPPPSAIEAMGLKDAAKARMSAAGVPVTPGYLGEDQSPARLRAEADAIGYPVLIKAVAGGGGKGMRKVLEAREFVAALASCQREAASSFGDQKVLIEKYVTRPRHIEVQVFGDSHGNVVHLFERDCSLQRRHQKVIEEAPAPGMDAATRAAVCDAAVKAAKAVNYEGAGTIEFIADASDGLKADRIWFMEMNTRLQVEHPVTEMITGQDLVEWQLRVASGEPLPLKQDELKIDGWAMEARLYAENPDTGFLPSTGRLEHFRLPKADHVRVDSAVREGGEVSPFYDPMIAKIIVYAEDREDAAAALAAACAQVEVWPVKTNAAFLAACASHPEFLAGRVDTGFIENRQDVLLTAQPPSVRAEMAAAASFIMQSDEDSWSTLRAPAGNGLFGFRLNGPPTFTMPVFQGPERRSFEITGLRFTDEVHRHSGFLMAGGGEQVSVFGMPNIIGFDRSEAGSINVSTPDPDTRVIFEGGRAHVFTRLPPLGAAAGASDGSILSPMPGKVVSVSVKAGDTVTKGQTLLVLEAMKMEHALTAPFDGVVAELSAVAGGQVSEGVVLAKLEAA
ncbi:MAG: acetyl/propionyl/methylcrotonyl-CoA carboxylase subunit alpha [Caulobacter sp.]|nr:acetyl/propionyl/methylcrotonyl-CoA carboxylase subunit alpha [Caulobacter sp.]